MQLTLAFLLTGCTSLKPVDLPDETASAPVLSPLWAELDAARPYVCGYERPDLSVRRLRADSCASAPPFGPPYDLTVPGNPMDVWASPDGLTWTQGDEAPSNADSAADVKYDFDALLVPLKGKKQAIMTFGGDRETFDFSDPLNYLNVDNDVWTFAPSPPRKHRK